MKKARRISIVRLVFENAPGTVAPMPSDRPYMRDDYPRERTSVLTWLISAIVAGFVVQFVMSLPWVSAARSAEYFLGVSVRALERGWVWTLFTHGFLHSTSFIVHAVFNVFALYFLGRELVPMLGSKRFLNLFFTATVIGGSVWAATHWRFGGNATHVGTTPAVAALFTVFACFFPRQPLSFLLFFVFPITLRPKHLLVALTTIAACGFFFYELPGNRLPFDIRISSSAHLGGILVGFLYFKYVHDRQWTFGRRRDDIELPRWIKRTGGGGRDADSASPAFLEEVPPPAAPDSKDNLRAEVDRILDKINSEGLGALTPEEKALLDTAKDLLSRR